MKEQQTKDRQMNDKTNCASFNEANFQEEVLNSEQPVLAVFEAEWSGTCDIMTPIMENLCLKFRGQFKIGMIDVDRNGKLAEDYRISSIPALFFFSDGEIVDHIIGLVPRQVIEGKFNDILRSSEK